LVVPPFAFFVSLSSATFSYFIISMFFSRPVKAQSSKTDGKSRSQPQVREKVLENTKGVAGNASRELDEKKDGSRARPTAETTSSTRIPAGRKDNEVISSETGSGTGSTTSTAAGASD
jgi:hypothetical protein